MRWEEGYKACMHALLHSESVLSYRKRSYKEKAARRHMKGGHMKGSYRNSLLLVMRVTPLTCESDKVPIAPLRVRVRGDAGAYEYGNEAAEKDHAHCDAQAHGVVAPWVLDVPGKGGSAAQAAKQTSEQAGK